MVVAQTLMHHLWLGENLKDAIAAPVLFVDSQTGLTFEPKFDEVRHFKTSPGLLGSIQTWEASEQ